MQPILFVDYNFTVLHDGSIKMDSELDPKAIGLKNGDIFFAYVNSGSIFLRKYSPNEPYKSIKDDTMLGSGNVSS